MPNDEYAEVIRDWMQMDTGSPAPLVFATENTTHILFHLSTTEEWHPHYAKLLAAGQVQDAQTAVASFHRCVAHQFGSPNDEALHGHRLWKNGLGWYKAHQVYNSQWITKLKRINSVHEQFSASHWGALKHYIITFHDSIFECVAHSMTTTTHTTTPLSQIMRKLAEEVNLTKLSI